MLVCGEMVLVIALFMIIISSKIGLYYSSANIALPCSIHILLIAISQ